VGSCEHVNESSGSIKSGEFFTSLGAIGFARRAPLHGVNYYIDIAYYFPLNSTGYIVYTLNPQCDSELCIVCLLKRQIEMLCCVVDV
jgi:hypothetical protein